MNNNCEKVGYTTLSEVQNAKRMMKKVRKIEMNHYLCDSCGNYHLTTKSAKNKFVRAKPARVSGIDLGPIYLDREPCKNLPKPVKAVTNLGELLNEVREGRGQGEKFF